MRSVKFLNDSFISNSELNEIMTKVLIEVAFGWKIDRTYETDRYTNIFISIFHKNKNLYAYLKYVFRLIQKK